MATSARACPSCSTPLPDEAHFCMHCHCDCGERDRLRSLLSCFETRMPTTCGICRESAELALRVHREGGTLADVRAALDRKYGD